MYNGDFGGGFMLNSSQRSGSQNSPGGGEHKASEYSLRPVTIKQILSAEQAHQDAEMYIGGAEIGQLTVVAQVVSVQMQTTNCNYYIDDGTGRIEARMWSTSSTKIDDNEIQNEIRAQMYVRVTGTLKNFGNKRYINASSVRPSVDPHELYFHLLEVMYVNIAHERGPPPRPGQEGMQVANGTSTNGYSAYTSTAVGSGGGMGDQYASLKPLARRIIDFILAQPPTDEGVHVAAIARHVQTDAGSISSALDELMDGGHVFSTIDESHFKPSL